MCGIAGFLFNQKLNDRMTPADRAILACYLMSAMDKRGGDSYGIAKLDSKGKMKTWRGLGRAVGSLKWQALERTSQIMAHTRKRTHGAIDLFNAHPIQSKHILGCHNGIISNHDELNKKYGRDFELDSRHLFAHLAQGRSFADINVYGAISYIDLNNPTSINLIKLSLSGDLQVYGIGTNVNDVQGCIYASTKDPIIGAATALHLDAFPYDIKPKMRYWIDSNGSLRVNNTPIEVGIVTSRNTAYSGYRGGYKDTSTTSTTVENKGWLQDFKPCKRCRRNKKKAEKVDGSFGSIDLCKLCWVRYCTKKYPMPDPKGLDKILERKRTCVYNDCRDPVKVVYLDVNYCAEHWRDMESNIQKVALAKEEAKAWEEAETARNKVIPFVKRPYQHWQLCHWDADEIRKRPSHKFQVDSLCPGCKKHWDEMMSAITRATSVERMAYVPVVECSRCHEVVTFMVRRGMEKAYCTHCEIVAGSIGDTIETNVTNRPICFYCTRQIEVGDGVCYSVVVPGSSDTKPFHLKFCQDNYFRKQRLLNSSVVL